MDGRRNETQDLVVVGIFDKVFNVLYFQTSQAPDTKCKAEEVSYSVTILVFFIDLYK